MSENKSIILCADDFGLHSGVSKGILQLAQLLRLSAVSCMVNRPDFDRHAKDLLAFKNTLQIGLHFNLTEGHFLSDPDRPCFGFKELLAKSYLGWIKPAWIAKEWKAQLDHFIETMGRLPDFIDGHQHIHQFPQIRQCMLALYEQRLRTHGTWIRSTYPAITLPQYGLKGHVMAMLGGKALYADLKKVNIACNSSFSGVYDFSSKSNYRSLFKRWLSLVPADTLIMCHPGQESVQADLLAETRKVEFRYFLSNEFLIDCQEFGVSLGLIKGKLQ